MQNHRIINYKQQKAIRNTQWSLVVLLNRCNNVSSRVYGTLAPCYVFISDDESQSLDFNERNDVNSSSHEHLSIVNLPHRPFSIHGDFGVDPTMAL